ncbi:hypothetical protein MUN88_00300 [Gracilibacillus caseinilyticus]|uniref:Uncharacterized protein n=1 Tax=Gracilibacillus caseinilyticus TaxID=2932256 RepID=A0ABY4F2I6_9BACI|nr:hypothetical protein [Gracilibacillus caseinilyticus]UOQ48641.1 hypothetical protein MUN88_00300 [Gracilibacillus caseinilyticus]
MLHFIDNLAQFVYSISNPLLKSLCYFFAGVTLVAVPCYLFVWLLEWLY